MHARCYKAMKIIRTKPEHWKWLAASSIMQAVVNFIIAIIYKIYSRWLNNLTVCKWSMMASETCYYICPEVEMSYKGGAQVLAFELKNIKTH